MRYYTYNDRLEWYWKQSWDDPDDLRFDHCLKVMYMFYDFGTESKASRIYCTHVGNHLIPVRYYPFAGHKVYRIFLPPSISQEEMRQAVRNVKEFDPDANWHFHCLPRDMQMPKDFSGDQNNSQEARSDIDKVLAMEGGDFKTLRGALNRTEREGYYCTSGSGLDAMNLFEIWCPEKKEAIKRKAVPGHYYESIMINSTKNIIKKAYTDPQFKTGIVTTICYDKEHQPVALAISGQDIRHSSIGYGIVEIGLRCGSASPTAQAMIHTIAQLKEMGVRYCLDADLDDIDPGGSYHKRKYTRPEEILTKRYSKCRFDNL